MFGAQIKAVRNLFGLPFQPCKRCENACFWRRYHQPWVRGDHKWRQIATKIVRKLFNLSRARNKIHRYHDLDTPKYAQLAPFCRK